MQNDLKVEVVLVVPVMMVKFIACYIIFVALEVVDFLVLLFSTCSWIRIYMCFFLFRLKFDHRIGRQGLLKAFFC